MDAKGENMERGIKRLLALALCGAMLLGTIACGGEKNKGKIAIGSKDFTESILVSEMYAQLLEANGYAVERRQALGGTPIIQESMLSGDVSLYPEYTSTGIATVLKEEQEFDPQAAYEKVKAGYAEQFDFVWLAMSGVNNSQALAITQQAAQTYGVTNLTELSAAAPQLRLCATPEFEERDDGLKGLKERMGAGGFAFASVRVYDKGIKYQVLRNGEADVNVCFTTDADLSKGDIIALTDDIQFWPPYYLAPVIRGDVLKANPGVEALLNALSAKLDTNVMQNLNARVDIDQEEYAAVAEDFLQTEGLIK